MSHFATGHSWLHHRSQYRKQFGADVPQWLLAFDVPMKLRIIKVALHTGMPLAQTVLVDNEFQDG